MVISVVNLNKPVNLTQVMEPLMVTNRLLVPNRERVSVISIQRILLGRRPTLATKGPSVRWKDVKFAHSTRMTTFQAVSLIR